VARVSFEMDDVQLTTNLEQFGAEVNKRITLAVDFAAGEGVKQLKTQAPWTDRTTNARSGLVAVPEHSGVSQIGFAQHEIIFAHAVTYGIWLEICNHKKYQIIMPTVIDVGKHLMNELSTLFDDLETTHV